ncbi:MAG: T9SS type A sorting domain-containing protein [Fidelibacterota bacterium]|nr:MAG: T9SS type A sorting domain-containing protein [Candidatus Neomarinimicrobiota bacterium]
MKNTPTILASLLCIVFLQPTTAQTDIDFFPLHVGSYWIHRTDTLGGIYDPGTYRIDIPGVDTVDGVPLYQFLETTSADDGSPAWRWCSWIRLAPEGVTIHALGDTALVDSADFFDTPLLWWPTDTIEPGHTWQFSSYEMGGHFSFLIEDTAASITVPVGTFDNCIRIKLVQTIDDVMFQTSWYTYAPGVGQVSNIGTNTWMGGSFRFELTEYYIPTVSVNGREHEMPVRFHLLQNYPNPFNPVSTIRYDLPTGGAVSLIVYDILGREVVRLVDGYMEPGHHQVQWNARAIPSGIYIARLLVPPTAGVTQEYARSIRMLLLK